MRRLPDDGGLDNLPHTERYRLQYGTEYGLNNWRKDTGTTSKYLSCLKSSRQPKTLPWVPTSSDFLEGFFERSMIYASLYVYDNVLHDNHLTNLRFITFVRC